MSSFPWLVPLSEARDIARVGGKAINLAKLIAADLPVPDGFVVTTDAYRAAGGADLPDDLVRQVREAYEQMGSPMVAARSSATAEDMAEASMAGQYETFLNLSGAEALLVAISDCWKSMRSDRLRAYLQEQGIAPESVAMAVVVQRLVPANAAGVLFTADPQTGSLAELLIEAAWGLGEGVVSGAVQPDRIRMSATEPRVIDYQVSEKHTRLVPGARDFEEVPLATRRRACLSYDALNQLWMLGSRVARHFGVPQDIEWAEVEGKIYLLQSRAITTLREASLRHGFADQIRENLRCQLDAQRGPWVRHNLDETLSHPSPLTWSLIQPFMSGAGGFGKMHFDVGFSPSDAVCREGFLELIGGRIYMDCARMPEMFSDGYPFAYDVTKLREDPDAAQQAPTLSKGTWRKIADAGLQAQGVGAKLREIAVDLDRRFDREFVPAVDAWCREESACDLSALEDSELIGLWENRRTKVFDDFGVMAFLPSMIEAFATAELRAFLEEYAWEEEPETLLHQLIVSGTPDQTLQSNIRLQEVGQGKRTRDEWLCEFGMRGPGEFDLANPRWFERPDDLNEMSTRLAGEASLCALQSRRQEESSAAFRRICSSLTIPLREELSRRVDLASRYVRFREDGKCQLMRAYALLRPVALEIGKRLDIGDDVFLLESREMLSALESGYVPKDRLSERRLLRRVESGWFLPRVIDSDDMATLGEVFVASDALCLPAHSLSSGSCSGIARIVHSPETAGDLGKNYVLICSSTDPSWTPLFVGASGLILECGGALSHGAIVARELGLPALVLEGATRIFKNGEPLTLDATRGQIIRGVSADETIAISEADNPDIERKLQPPLPSAQERAAGRRGLLIGGAWAVFLLGLWLLPAAYFQDPLFGLLDTLLWPLVAHFGRVASVALIAIFFAAVPLYLQKHFTDNERLLVARDRAANLRTLSGRLPKGSARKKTMEQLAAPVTMRILKAAMTSLAFVLGPMMLIFLWLPARLDPASWNASAGQTVSVVTEVQGDGIDSLTLQVPAPLELEPVGAASKVVPPIRKTLEDLRIDWAQASDVSAYPWELQAMAEQANQMMKSSLDRFLAGEIPSQKFSWRLRVPEQASGHYRVQLHGAGAKPTELILAFGNARPPAPTEMIPASGPVLSLKVVYPRALRKNSFWAPWGTIDLGWLGVYLLAYLPAMGLLKKHWKVA